MDAADRSRRTGVAMAAGGMAVLSTEAVTIRLAGVPAMDAVFWIGCFTFVVALGWIRVMDHTGPLRALRRGGSPLLAAGVLQGATTTWFVVAVSTTSVANVVVLLSGAPLAAALLAWWWLGERITQRVALGIGAAVIGSAIVVAGSAGGSGGRLAGDLATIAAVVCFGATTTILRRHPDLSRPVVVGTGGLVMVGVGAWSAAPASLDARAWALLILVGCVTSPVARVLLASAPRYLPAAQVGLFVPVETVLAILWAFVVFAEVPTAATVLGAGVILAGLLVAVLGDRGPGISSVDAGPRRPASAGTSSKGVGTPGRSPWRRRRPAPVDDRAPRRRG